MVDRIKYFLLGLLFLIVAGVIAYDSWNSQGVDESIQTADARDAEDRVDLDVRPMAPLSVEPLPAEPRLEFDPAPPVVRNEPPTIIEPPAPRTKPKPPAPKSRVHIVRSGENLEKISMRYYNTRKGVAWIVEANGLANANRIYQKQKLVIPARKENVKGQTPRKPVVVKRPAATVPSSYTVKAGDGDLYAICRRLYGSKGQGARVAHIMELNGIWSARVLPGTKLTLPPR